MSTLQNVIFDGNEIRGTSYYQESFPEFSSNKEEQSGYYLAVNVGEWEGAKFRIDRGVKKGTEVAFNGDGIAILFLGKDRSAAKTATNFVYISPETEETSFSLKMNFS